MLIDASSALLPSRDPPLGGRSLPWHAQRVHIRLNAMWRVRMSGGSTSLIPMTAAGQRGWGAVLLCSTASEPLTGLNWGMTAYLGPELVAPIVAGYARGRRRWSACCVLCHHLTAVENSRLLQLERVAPSVRVEGFHTKMAETEFPGSRPIRGNGQ